MRVIRLIILLCDTRIGICQFEFAEEAGISDQTAYRYLKAIKKEFGDALVMEKTGSKKRYRLVGAQARLIAEAAYA